MNTTTRGVLALTALLLLPVLAAAQCQDWIQGPLDDGTLPNGTDGYLNDSLTWDPDGAGPLAERLVVAGNFNTIGGVAAQNIAQYDPSSATWSPLGSGIAATVLSLAVYDGQVVAGCVGDNNVGTFDQTVRRWTGSAWVSLPATNTGNVYDMAVYNGSLYIAGTFVTQFVVSGSNPGYYIARYNPGANLWEAVDEAGFGSQTNTAVRALQEYNGELYAAGWKASAGSITGSAINISHGFGIGAGSWTTITGGTDPGGIYDLDIFSGELLIAGGFLEVNGVTCRNFAGWNGSSFHAFQGGVTSTTGGSTIWSVTIHNGICIGGDFTTAGGTTVNRVAFWPPGGSAWQALGGGIDSSVYDLTSYRGELIAVGSFTNAGGPANDIAHWNGTSWAAFGGGNASYVLAYTNFNGRLVAGGSFHQPTLSLGTANNIAGWSGGPLSSFGTGMNGDVYALATFKYPSINGSYELIAGGSFTTAGGVAAQRIARWNENPFTVFPPPAWAAMGAGFNGVVQTIARSGGYTYAGGSFTASGATTLNRVARWNETTDVWENLTGLGGMNGTVYALKEFNGSLYAGGSFTTAGGSSTGGLARWTGSGWAQVGGFFSGTVYALEVYNGSLIIGGQFPGLPNGANIAAYNGTSYFNLGTGGTNSVGVRSLKVNGSRLYAGGAFTTIGGVSVNNLGWWDGASWHDANGGVNGVVWALGSANGEAHVGGDFSTAHGGLLYTPRWARYTETGLPWFSLSPYPWSQYVDLGANVMFSASTGGGFPGITYQWTRNNVPLTDGVGPYGSTISGSSTQVLHIDGVVFADQGAYRVVATSACGSVTSDPGTLALNATSGTSSEARISIFRSIGPNPTGGPSTLAFSLAKDADVSYSVFDLRGRRVRQLELGHLPAGTYEERWDTRDDGGRSVAAGVYFVSLQLDGQRRGAKRLTIIR